VKSPDKSKNDCKTRYSIEKARELDLYISTKHDDSA